MSAWSPSPPLEQTPAQELFADRAAAALPGFVMDDYGKEICRRLDGLPLALELAAARLRTLPVRELAQRLDDRFRLLTGGSRTALPRHRTLRAVVDWSWDLLDEPERRLARRLAVFSAGATVESASAVDETDALDGLAALVERSLLQVVPDSEPTRYRMLETLREYGLEKLEEAGELQDVRTRQARYFAQLAARAEPELRRADQRRWYALLGDERENIVAGLRHLGDTGDARAALKLAVTLLWYWLLSGSEDEARTWLEFALAVPGEADPDDRALAAGVLKLSALGKAGDMEELQRGVRELLDAAEVVDDRERPLVAMAKVVLWLFSGEEERADEAQAIAFEHPDPWVRAAAHMLAAGRAENAGSLDAMRTELADRARALRGARRQLGAGDGTLPGGQPAAARGRPRGGAAEPRGGARGDGGLQPRERGRDDRPAPGGRAAARRRPRGGARAGAAGPLPA